MRSSYSQKFYRSHLALLNSSPRNLHRPSPAGRRGKRSCVSEGFNSKINSRSYLKNLPHPFPSPGGRGVLGSLLPPGEGPGMREGVFEIASRNKYDTNGTYLNREPNITPMEKISMNYAKVQNAPKQQPDNIASPQKPKQRMLLPAAQAARAAAKSNNHK